MLEEIKRRLGANYIEGTDEIIEDLIDNIMSIASNITNRSNTDSELYPYVKKAVVSEYLQRGAEGMTSRSEGSLSSSFEDVIDKMRTNLIKDGLRRLR
jgi:hypothetical protein